MVVSLDMHDMCRVLHLDKASLLVSVEAGITGKHLEAVLKAQGVTLGHEPDSWEFSTVGGWLATRASGMKKNIYGNFDEMVQGMQVVTPSGVLSKHSQGPRSSTGPDVFQMILGSEGNLGVVTEVTLRVAPVPPVQKFASFVFPSFAEGVNFMFKVARARIWPASLRLMDNDQFVFGQALKPSHNSQWKALVDGLSKAYVLNLRGFKVEEMCAASVQYEGPAELVAQQEVAIRRIAAAYGGIEGGAENGERAYTLTFLIAYLRDIGLDYYFIAESFETSVAWGSVQRLCDGVKACIQASCQKRGITRTFISCRVTQLYDTGACVYFYFGFNFDGVEGDPAHVYEEIEEEARDAIIGFGGTLSHHHGVGKVRKRWMEECMSPAGMHMLRGVKQSVDAQNIFGINNTY